MLHTEISLSLWTDVVYFEEDLLDGDSAVQSFQFDTLEVAGQSSFVYARRW